MRLPIRKVFCLCSAIVLTLQCVAAQTPLPRSLPVESDQAQNTFHIRDGFRMELLAAEPLVTDPVAMEYDEDGRAYVAEMKDYPYTGAEKDKPFTEQTASLPLGQIRLLVDTDGDGDFDSSTVFAEQLSWPTGLAVWKGGIFVVATPDLWYLKDNDGDGRADIRERLLTGFRKFNVQAVINNLKWGMDHRLYGAGSSNGGSIHSGEGSNGPVMVMSTGDFRMNPADPAGSFELLSGGARFGNTFDDWGNRFICNIRNPIQHVVIPRHYTARNPFAVFRPPVQDVAVAGDTIPVWRRSPPEPWRILNARRLAGDGSLASPRSESSAAGYMTSASGVTIYRGNAYPPEYYGSVFLGEVAGNLIHHEMLSRQGVTFSSRPSGHESEFLASTDNWFRPVNFVNAPDGTLHVLDMYRETIEHPWSIPDDIKSQLDLESGRDRGRIYRLASAGFSAPAPPRLGTAPTNELVERLQDPRSWYRETAHRLIFERQDKAATEALRNMLKSTVDTGTPGTSDSEHPESPDYSAMGRLLALWSLHGLQQLSSDDLLTALRDPHPGVRIQGVLLTESMLAEHPELLAELLAELVRLADDRQIEVRYQVACSLGAVLQNQGEFSGGSGALSGSSQTAVEGLARIALRDPDDSLIHAAVLSSTALVSVPVIEAILRGSVALQADNLTQQDQLNDLSGGGRILLDLAGVVGVRSESNELAEFFKVTEQISSGSESGQLLLWQLTAGLGKGLQRGGKSLGAVLSTDSSSGAKRMADVLADSAEYLDLVSLQSSSAVSQQIQAAELLAYVDYPVAAGRLLPWLQADRPSELQVAAVRILSGHRNRDFLSSAIENYRSLRPAARMETVDAMLSRTEWHSELLSAVEAGTIAVFDIPQIRRNQLLRSADPMVKERAVRLFTAALAARRDVVEKYREALRVPADRNQGELVYRRECQACHRSGTEGQELGPNLRTIRHRSPEEVMLHILDPNREVAPTYVAQVLVLHDGRSLTGIITSEDANSVTLKTPAGSETNIGRGEIAELTSTGQSLMPVGFEQRISVSEMASLVEFLLR